MRTILSGVLLAGLMIGVGAFSPAASFAAEAEVATTKAVDVGNKTCPVMGGEASPGITAEYKGKIYHFCCPMCIQTFQKDPEKYSKIADDEVAAQQAK